MTHSEKSPTAEKLKNLSRDPAVEAVMKFLADPNDWEAENNVIEEVLRWGNMFHTQVAFEIYEGYCDNPERRPLEYGIRGAEFLAEAYGIDTVKEALENLA